MPVSSRALGLLSAAVLACVPATGRQGAAPTPAPGTSRDSSKPTSGTDTTQVKAYGTVIPAGTTTRRGMFITHLVGSKLYFEIPRRELGKDMLLSTSLARSFDGGYGGNWLGERVLRWERNKNRILLRSPSYRLAADSTLPIARAVAEVNDPPVVAVFPVEAYGPDSAAVIDVTRLYTTNIPEFVGFEGELDEKRCYVERVTAFPDNVEVEATQTGVPSHSSPDNDDDEPKAAKSVVTHWSMVRLPEHPMLPRIADERVGFETVVRLDFGTSEHRAAGRRYITRWRLEKKDPTAAVSDPVTPLVYYVDPATPEQWRPWVKRGIEEWQRAFEAAGFRNAIVAKDPPTDDPDWSVDDIRHTVVRWLASTTENAYGPTTSDPRTGEIFNGSVRISHNVMKLVRSWYFTQVGPLDPRAQHLPLPDSLVGRLVEYAVAHEVGHTLGLDHDQLGSAMYPADSVRSRTWVHRMGHTPSVMDYSRFNYVAQPEDSIALEDLIPRVGPADIFNIRWGYTPIPGARTMEDERMTLDAWARVQDTVPWYRFSGYNMGGYGTFPEAVGDADPVKSTGYGTKNIRRVLGFLAQAALRPGEDNSDLHELYDRTLMQWTREMRHVVTLVGGSTVQYKSGSQPGPVYTPLPADRQRQAVRFLDTAALQTPRYFVDLGITRRFEAVGTLARISGVQASLLADLLGDSRMVRLAEYEALATDRKTVYPLTEMLGDVRQAVWRELGRPSVSIDMYRQALQRAYLDLMRAKVNAPRDPAPTPSNNPLMEESQHRILTASQPLLRGELLTLQSDVQKAMARTVDQTTRLHLMMVSHEIKTILDPKS